MSGADDAAVRDVIFKALVSKSKLSGAAGIVNIDNPEVPDAIIAALRAAGHLRTPGTVEVKPGLLSVLRDAAAYAVRNYPPNGMPEQEPTDTWQSAIFVADAALAAGADDGG